MSDELRSFDTKSLHEYRLDVDVGEPSSIHGLTRVRLDGDGGFRANLIVDESQRVPGEKAEGSRSVKGQIPRDLTENLFREIHQFPWDRRFPSRPGIPDEAVVLWTLRRGENQESLKVWLREAEEDPVLAPVLEALRKKLAELSDNQLFL